MIDINTYSLEMYAQKVTILDKSNWTVWKKSVEIKCLRKGAKKELTTTTDAESKEEGEAQTVIMESLNEEDQHLVAGCESAKTMMEKLEKRYKQCLNIYTVTRELTELRWKNNMDAGQFINRLNDVRLRFKSIDPNTADDAFIFKLIGEL